MTRYWSSSTSLSHSEDYSRPGFPTQATYRFLNPLYRHVILQRLSASERAHRAARLLASQRATWPVRTRQGARLVLELARQLRDKEQRGAYETELAWWISVEEAEALTQSLAAAVQQRQIAPEFVWAIVRSTRDRWPAYRRLALLDALRHQEQGLALQELSDFYATRSELLREVGRYQEALEDARTGLSFCEAESLLAARLHSEIGLACLDLGEYKQALSPLRSALAIREQALGPDHPDTAQSLNNLAALYYAQGRYAEAEPLYRRALAIREQALGPDHPDTAQSLNNLAALYYAQGRYAEAEPLYRRALAIREQALGPDHPDTAQSLNNLAALYYAQGRYAEAEPLYRRALAIWEQALGPDHPDTATSLNNLAGLYDAQGRYAEAEPLYQRALAIREQALGPDHPDTATSLNNLAGLYDTQGRYAEAEPLYRRALAIREQALGPDHPDTAHKPQQPGRAVRRPGALRRGRAAVPAGAGDPGAGAGPGPPRHRHQPQQPGRAVRRPGALRRGRAAVPAGPGAPRAGAGPGPPRHRHQPQQPGRAVPRPGALRRGRAAVPAGAGDPRAGAGPGPPRPPPPASTTWPCCTTPRGATPRPSRCTGGRWRSASRRWGRTTPTPPPASTTWPRCTDAQGRYAEAEPLYRRALAIREQALGPDHPDHRQQPQQPGRAVPRPGALRRGRAAVPAGAGDPRAGAGAGPPRHRPPASTTWPGCTDAQGRYAEAEPLYRRALDIVESVLGPTHPTTATIRANYAALLKAMKR